jgi:hypothetical protein
MYKVEVGTGHRPAPAVKARSMYCLQVDVTHFNISKNGSAVVETPLHDLQSPVIR